MERVTLTQAMRILEVNNHRLKQLLESTGIIPEAAQNDRKSKFISMAQVEQLRLAHIAKVRTTITRPEIRNMEGNSVIATLLIRIETIERRLRVLEGLPRVAEHATVSTSERAYVPTRVQVGQRGFGVRPAGRLAVQHGARQESSARDWPWQDSNLVDRRTVLHFIKSYLAGHPASGTWQICETPDCGCEQI